MSATATPVIKEIISRETSQYSFAYVFKFPCESTGDLNTLSDSHIEERDKIHNFFESRGIFHSIEEYSSATKNERFFCYCVRFTNYSNKSLLLELESLW